MNSKHRITLRAIFAKKINANLEWAKIEALLVALGCEVYEKGGSLVSFEKDGLRVTVHRPHPEKHALPYRIKNVRNFLLQLGVTP